MIHIQYLIDRLLKSKHLYADYCWIFSPLDFKITLKKIKSLQAMRDKFRSNIFHPVP